MFALLEDEVEQNNHSPGLQQEIKKIIHFKCLKQHLAKDVNSHCGLL